MTMAYETIIPMVDVKNMGRRPHRSVPIAPVMARIKFHMARPALMQVMFSAE